MLSGKRFILWGLCRLSVRVAQAMTAGRAEVTVVRLRGEADTLLPLLGAGVRTVEAEALAPADTLRAAGLAGATALLALSENDLDNLHAAVAAREAAPDVPVVLRAFDPLLADQLEQGGNVRRAYSVSALAAPAFVAAACGDAVLETLRLGDGEVPLCRVTVKLRSPLLGLGADAVKAQFACAVLARAAGGDAEGHDWRTALGDDAQTPLRAGETILIGGPRESVLRAVTQNAGWRSRRRPFWSAAPRSSKRRTSGRPTRLLPTAIALSAVLIASVFVFRFALHLSPIDALYFVVTTATTTGYGDISLKDSADWVKLFGCFIMLTGGALLGIVFSYLAALATAERLDETLTRQAGRLTGHVVVAGLGNLGYRVARQVSDLGLDAVVIDPVPRPRFAEALRGRAPVLTGDASLPDTLERAAIGSAAAFLACTNDDLVNIQACLHARRLCPEIVSVARIFDEALSGRISDTFGINCAQSASSAAVSAFVGAATDELALRTLPLGSLLFLAGRYETTGPITADILAAWRGLGVRHLAFRLPGGPMQPPSAAASSLATHGPWPLGTEIILCGPADAVRTIFSS